ncbi:MAG: hypothetical protein Q8S11_08815 [Daejeonella sp.]|uniref:hypothetical protein n=1 Tax=Daejeonella sp. TaxID=2805397 RepID=UPI00273630A8|nr:hypothetical protein [Daejeonella sp.]MDP3468422.1 hypothetical protein [Daejeonella sp.]
MRITLNSIYSILCFSIFLVSINIQAFAADFYPQAVQGQLKLATFDVDATPPVGSSLTYDPMINSWDLGLRAKGIVILGAGEPIVMCSVDWIGIANDSQDEFKRIMAEAAGTIPSRVVVHAIHQHDAPTSDFGAELMLKTAGLSPLAFEGGYARDLVQRLGQAIRKSIASAVPFTHIGTGQAEVYKVASNRRILGSNGKVKYTRTSAAKDSVIRAAPEGLIDPMVSLISFWNNDKPIAVLSYYASHPQSYYRTGISNPDFPGIARFMRQLAVPDALHIHFNGAGGNLTAGKYNDGAKENRLILAERLADGMKRAWNNTKLDPVSPAAVNWTIEPVAFKPAAGIENLETAMKTQTSVFLSNNLSKLVWLKRLEAGKKIDISLLSIGRARILHLPGEPFVEYQLAAKAERPDLFVAVAGYGDYAVGYIGNAIAYSQGGYETGQASGVTAEAEGILMKAIHKLLTGQSK